MSKKRKERKKKHWLSIDFFNLQHNPCTLTRMKTVGQHKLDELTRRLGVFEEEFKRSTDRANGADNTVTGHDYD